MRAYSVFALKSVDEEQRILEGVATTPTPDRMEDVVEPLGARFTLPLPFMWQHGKDPFVGQTPVGTLIWAQPNTNEIPVRIQMARADTLGRLKDILDFAWSVLRKGLVRGLSIGFRPLDEPIPIDGTTWGLRYPTWEWLELSAVTIPANADATITAIKSAIDDLDRRPRPTAPRLARARGVVHLPGVAGLPSRKGIPMKTYSDRVQAFAAERAAKLARQQELMGADDGQTLDEAQQEEFDTLQKDITAIDQHLARLTVLEETLKASAKAVHGSTPEEGLASRSAAPVVTVRANRDPGIGFARVVLCRLAGFVHQINPVEVAKARYPDDLAVQYFLKAATPIGAGTTLDATNASPLAYLQDLPSEFIEFLRPMTIIGRMPGLRRVPFNVRMVGQTTGGTAGWVGQAKPKPLTKFDFAQVSLTIAKLAAIAVIADELAMLSQPNAETVIRDSLAGAIVSKQDHDFIDPASAAVANVKPASITNGLTPLSSSGTTPDNIRHDIGVMVATFLAANQDPSTAVWIMPNVTALNLSLMVNALGQPEFPGLTMMGGTLGGLPVVTSQQAAMGGVTGNLVVLANAGEIFLADDGSVAIDVNRYASLEMTDTPTQDGAAGTGASLVSLWQNNLIGIRGERHINWVKRRPEAVVFMQAVAWAPLAPAGAGPSPGRGTPPPPAH